MSYVPCMVKKITGSRGNLFKHKHIFSILSYSHIYLVISNYS